MENMHFCQSCAMPLNDDAKGTNADGSKNEDYCSYCFENGSFKDEMTMEQMINFCAPMMAEHNPDLTEEKAKEQMMQFFPQLKRWKAS